MKNLLSGFLMLCGGTCIIGARIAGIHMTEGELLIAFWWLFALGVSLTGAGAWLWRRADNEQVLRAERSDGPQEPLVGQDSPEKP